MLAAAERRPARHHELDPGKTLGPLDPRRSHQQVRGDFDRGVVLRPVISWSLAATAHSCTTSPGNGNAGSSPASHTGDRGVLLERALHLGVHVQPIERFGSGGWASRR